MNNLAEKYIGIKEPDYRSLATNKDLVFIKKEDGLYYSEKGNKFTASAIEHDLKLGYLKELKHDS